MGIAKITHGHRANEESWRMEDKDDEGGARRGGVYIFAMSYKDMTMKIISKFYANSCLTKLTCMV